MGQGKYISTSKVTGGTNNGQIWSQLIGAKGAPINFTNHNTAPKSDGGSR